jgi:hypothetical protein
MELQRIGSHGVDRFLDEARVRVLEQDDAGDERRQPAAQSGRRLERQRARAGGHQHQADRIDA